ncbi:hypothetical protein DL764_010621 [Monosporascus ibericus]|uniref:D-xylose 1-dehydrogenase (NADP(+), D-xylono-1,5-lactone-forming) n=1 Tax=Monosporascus ibericus TaxID=155417 RepID=A0A4Q4SV08_9PEZI|nr:hypothetical protein DL764_010621 [Monosporascus ibericus]
MAGMISRLWQVFNPPKVEKRGDALKFGILGAASVGLIGPAKSHSEVIVQAVAARDRKKAEAYAKSHGIPDVKDTYRDILDDPEIDCVFIPLVNSLHYEWAARSIRAGKHVLLEKPSVSNAAEAEMLFNMPELSEPNGPVILEAFHTRFYPSWVLFRSLINPADVAHVSTFSVIPWWGTNKNDIHFNYSLSGGSIMAMGTYNLAALRLLFDAEPEECLSCDVNAYTDGVHNKCDYEFKAKFRFPNGGTGDAHTTMQGPTVWKPSFATVTCKDTIVPDDTLPASQEKVLSRELTLHGFIHGAFWHRIDVKESFEIRSEDTGKPIKKWVENKSYKAYTFKEAGGEFADLPGEVYWMSFRHQLEQFVNRVKGRKTQNWVTPADSIAQMKMIDMAYEKSGLGLRPTSTYK